MAEKADYAEAQKRVAEVADMMLAGENRNEIVRFGAKKWGIKARQIEKYMVKARAALRAKINERTELSVNWHLRARMRILSQAQQQRDARASLAVLRDIGELQGLYKEKVEITGKDGAPIEYIKLPETAKE